ncbi:MAG: GGDEF domain-containing protein [Candidatus Omnitrophica bacterium]|nr:GGDEF domain-containing protein [Candidatus Omnitrophota bacterium]
MGRFGTRRKHRRILLAAVATLLTSVVLLGLVGVTRWHGRQAVQQDTRTVIVQTGNELVRRLESRRGTLTFLRDTLKRQPDLAPAALSAMGASAVQHTRHLIGAGLVQRGQPPVWWAAPRLSAQALNEVNSAIVQRTRLRGVWRVPSTFSVSPSPADPLLIMFEPSQAGPIRQGAVFGVFEVKPLLNDFFSSGLPQHYPVQVLDGKTLLHRSGDWQADGEGARALVVEHSLRVDAARWTIQMQPGKTGVVKTLSWLNVLLLALSAIAGLGITTVVWILAARTWILQRAVARRTAALRRASQRLRQMAITDELTGLYNRRFFLNRMAWECDRAKRYRRPLACLMVDVNGFKQVNDRLGHLAGDLVLQQVARELQALLRQSDILARLGGDEFVIALPETGPDQAALVAEKLRQLRIRVPDMAAPAVSLSVGMSRAQPPTDSPQAVLDAADRSLYAYKRQSHSQEHHALRPSR